jgi:hypothetical protein
MATERGVRLMRVAAVAAAVVVAAMPLTTRASPPWWQPLGFAGQRVDAVSSRPGVLSVHTVSGYFTSTDGGQSFAPGGDAAALVAPPVTSAGVTWEIDGGTVMTTTAGGALAADPHAPYLGAGAHLLAAPGALPGVVVAVGSDNHVWRRSPSGSWATAFVLLPAGGLSGVPQVTSLAAFTQPLTVAVYMGVAGYGVLLTENGGDDWIRADPGLPENVLGLATDPAAKALYAATDQGLFVHQLQAFPAPPVYTDTALYLRWLGIGIVALIATVLALFTLSRTLPRRPIRP